MPPLQKNFPLDQTWSLRELNGKPVPSGLDISLKIDGSLARLRLHRLQFVVGDAVSGQGPASCRRSLALTKKHCPKDVMALELGFLSALLGSPEWDLVNGDLVIKGPRGAMRLARSL